MKFLILFLLSFNLYAAPCDEDSLANINACTRTLAEEGDRVFETEADFNEWKFDVIARITERNRVAAVKARFNSFGVAFGKYGSVSGLRDLMVKCNYSHPNPAIWIKTAMEAGNTAMVDCLESKKAEVAAEKLAEDNKIIGVKDARSRLKSVDCSTLTGQILQDMCIILKR